MKGKERRGNDERTSERRGPGAERRADAVNHPPHYTTHPSGVECIDVAEHYGFNLGNAIKYIWRAGIKSSDPLEDLRKARWYLNREIERLTKARAEPVVIAVDTMQKPAKPPGRT